MYKIFVRMIVSMLILLIVVGKAMDKLPSAKPCPRLVQEIENERKIREAITAELLREKYAKCIQIFDEESNEIKSSFQSYDSINS